MCRSNINIEKIYLQHCHTSHLGASGVLGAAGVPVFGVVVTVVAHAGGGIEKEHRHVVCGAAHLQALRVVAVGHDPHRIDLAVVDLCLHIVAVLVVLVEIKIKYMKLDRIPSEGI